MVRQVTEQDLGPDGVGFVEGGRVADLAPEARIVVREELHHERIVRDVRRGRANPVERCPFEAEPRVIGRDPFDQHQWLAPDFNEVEPVLGEGGPDALVLMVGVGIFP